MADKKEIEEGHHGHVGVGGILREAVFGFNDGVVSTFAVVAGLFGGALDNKTILLGALATLVAGAFSMGLGTFLGTKSERDHYEGARKRELWEMANIPEKEREEIRGIYAEKGFEGELLGKIVEKITSDDDLWLKTMMREELGFADKPPNPYTHGVVMSVSFVIGSGIVTLPYFFNADALRLFYITMGFAIAALLTIGASKTYFTKMNPFLSAVETMLVGALAAGASYGIGLLVSPPIA